MSPIFNLEWLSSADGFPLESRGSELCKDADSALPPFLEPASSSEGLGAAVVVAAGSVAELGRDPPTSDEGAGLCAATAATSEERRFRLESSSLEEESCSVG